jgi:hypothetical protein
LPSPLISHLATPTSPSSTARPCAAPLHADCTRRTVPILDAPIHADLSALDEARHPATNPYRRTISNPVISAPSTAQVRGAPSPISSPLRDFPDRSMPNRTDYSSRRRLNPAPTRTMPTRQPTSPRPGPSQLDYPPRREPAPAPTAQAQPTSQFRPTQLQPSRLPQQIPPPPHHTQARPRHSDHPLHAPPLQPVATSRFRPIPTTACHGDEPSRASFALSLPSRRLLSPHAPPRTHPS